MPELPEVETIKNDLAKAILNKKIVQLSVSLPRIVKNNLPEFRQTILHSEFKKISRVGKLIIIEISRKNKFLLIHLKMTGQLVYQKQNSIIGGGHSRHSPISDLPNKYTRASFGFIDGSRLFFNDMRTFGYMRIASRDTLKQILIGLGPDAASENFNFNDFYNKVRARKTSVKAVLLNQSIVAGIGNIYADEILFMAGILPQTKASALNQSEWEKIFIAIKPVLQNAVKHRGTTFNDYVDANGNKGDFIKYLNVYDREGEKCHKCGALIKKTKVAQRGTHYCPVCQK